MSAAVAHPSCVRCAFALDSRDLRCPICGLATPAARGNAPQAVGARVARCDECGAAVVWSAEDRSARCAFCSAATHVEDASTSVDMPEDVLRFAVTPEMARAAVRRWMGKGFLRPFGFASRARIEHLQPLWWAGWLIHTRTFVTWTADSDHGARRAGVAPHTGQAHLAIGPVILSASQGLPREMANLLVPLYDLSLRATTDELAARTAGPPDAQLELFETDRAALRATCVETIRVLAQQMLQNGVVPGTRHKRIRVEPIVETLSTRRLALPVYLLSYRFRDRVYRVVVHGQRVNTLHGEAPQSAIKIVVGVLLAIVVSILLLLLLALLGP